MKNCSFCYCRCQTREGCVTHGDPPADGTSCDEHHWCREGSCVEMTEVHDLEEVHGQWGEWSHWSECSKHCFHGIQKRLKNNRNKT